MDFFDIRQRSTKNGTIEVYPDFKVKRSKDLMVRGKTFYAIWDEAIGLWSTDEYDVQRLVDEEMMEYRTKLLEKTDGVVHVKFMSDFSTTTWSRWRNYLAAISDNAHELDGELTFQNTEVKKTDYVSRKLSYALEPGDTKAYDALMGVLYEPEERKKLEWALGAIISGEAKKIQKFIVLYGEGGSGKSTFLNIVQQLFEGYYTTFEAQALTSNNNSFSTEVFRDNPLVAIQHDGDLSRITDNTKLNSIVSHEYMTMNEKYKPSYTSKANCFLFLATNKPVRITDAKSGVIRRLIDVSPSGKKIPVRRYLSLVSRVKFELAAIAAKCLAQYEKMGKNYYATYKPLSMIFKTDVFFNFVETCYYNFLEDDGVSLSRAYSMYKTYCEDSLIEHKLPRHKFRDELRNYFTDFHDVTRINNKQVRSYFSGFVTEKFQNGTNAKVDEPLPVWLEFGSVKSNLDDVAAEYPAQLASIKYETPKKKWAETKSTLKDLNTSKLHYVKLPRNHIVVDFDIRDSDGEKSPELNLDAASKWTPTYGEFSKSGGGVHLHYIYDGDVDKVGRHYADGIELKLSTGDAALRRKLSKCNDLEIETINTGLPIKPRKKMINFDAVQSEQGLRDLIMRNVRKEIHPSTKPSVDFIYKILEDAHASGLPYDVSDMRSTVLQFAIRSTNQTNACVKLVAKMQFKSETENEDTSVYYDERLAFFDVEVFPNLFLVNWKYAGTDNKCVHMINPTPQEIEGLFKLKLVGFNNRRYDNHILYARYIGYDLEQLFNLSASIVGGLKRELFREAYGLSYADVFDFSSKKQSLKKFQIELGIHHQELGFPFDEPIAEEHWPQVIEYCDNDVVSTEAVFNDRHEDFTARRILAELSGLAVNSSTNAHTTRIIFGNERKPQPQFVYTDLSEQFPGYEYDFGKSTYRDECPGEGGYVYSEPGFYKDVALLDIASMHPSTIEILNMFGPFTDKYVEIKEARLAINRGDLKKARTMLGGVLDKYLGSVDDTDALSYALKIAINSVYGLTSAKFANSFKDPRNVDNIVAKRGALFMIDLKHAAKERGITVAHIKTDSIKIPNATKKDIDFVISFGAKYGYDFVLEATYDHFCLVNDAVYIARKKKTGEWTATGAEFKHPYVFKTLFSRKPVLFADMCETKTVTTALYLDFDEFLGDDEHNYVFVGKAGSFCPMKPGTGGGRLLRKKGDVYNAATGSKGYRWMESEQIRVLGKQDDIDLGYFRELTDKVINHISEYVPFEVFVS